MGRLKIVEPVKYERKSQGHLTIVDSRESPVASMAYDSAAFDLDGDYAAGRKLICDNYTAAKKDYRLYLLPTAADSIMDHIGWGSHTPENAVEQGGILVGTNYEDKERGIQIGIVKQAIPARQAESTPVYIYISPEDWKQIYQELDRMNAELPVEEQMIVMGWYHTHPNTLDVFMSGTDRSTQSSFFKEDRSMAVVLNPHRKIWKCFRSDACRDVRAEMLVGGRFADYGNERLYNKHWISGGR